MKKILLLLVLLLSAKITAQEIPLAQLETIDGETVSTQILAEQGAKPIVITFWATWCIPCLTELSAVNERLESWKEKYQFDLYAVSVDDDRTARKVAALQAGKGWDFKVLLDTNQDFKRKLNINSIPYLIVVKEGKIIFTKTGFVKGDEARIEKVISENQ
ncbi:TlpA disulfide reductase family protein [Flavobacterium sp. BFFFF1]|uniref:TlpA family protein disulfide reductase n=1 Tax=Flavobacterium sp. BFFFF1 TaxID=2015557 RepID=UPI0025C67B38|nr:TlpA disulfide reductase family protein [Flavobacterium sp. BFFFF1]